MKLQHGAARPLAEVSIAFALIELALWGGGRTQLLCAVAAAAWVAAATWWSRPTARELGVSGEGFRESLWIVPVAGALSGLFVAAGALAGTLHVLTGTRTPPWHAVLYAAWALAQEFLVQSFIFVRLEGVAARRALLWTALLFALAHLPNPVLIPASFALALVLTAAFRHYRNIYTLAIAHAVFGLGLAVSVPDAVTRAMRVGSAYFIGSSF